MNNFNELFKAGVHPARRFKGGVSIESTSSGGGCCEVDTHNKVRQLTLPRNTQARGRVVRAHELLHAEYSRLRKDATHPSPHIDNLAEDMMIQGRRFAVKFPHLERDRLSVALYDAWSCSKIPISKLPPMMRNGLYMDMLVEIGRAHIVLETMSARTPAEMRTHCMLETAIQRACLQMAKCTRFSAREFADRLEYAALWAKSVSMNSIRKDREIYVCVCRHLEKLLPMEPEGRRHGEPTNEPADERGGVDRTGAMAIFTPLLTKRCRVTRAGRRSRNAGTHIKASRLHRLKRGSITGLFREKSRDTAGIVLIDASGSMDVDNDNLNKLTAILPASTIAYYCLTSDTPNGCQGHLVIHADNGMRCDEIPRGLVNGGNGVDLHALRWLLNKGANNKGAMYFITDEHWASPDDEDEQTQKLLDQHRSEITVLRSFDDAWAHFDK